MNPPQAWPGLGFDPAPGSPSGAGGLAEQLSSTAKYLHETYEVLNSVRNQRGEWTGKASQAFAEKIGELPDYLDNAHRSLTKAGDALRGWETALTGFQNRARDLEEQARRARQDLEQAETTEQQARRDPAFDLAGQHFPTDAELQAANQQISAAQRAVDQAAAKVTTLNQSLENLLHQGKQLQDEHEGEADRTAVKIKQSDDGLAPPEPAWYEDVGNWFKDNAGEIGDVAGVISAVAGTLALFPPFTPFAGPIAIVAGGVALAAHGADMAVNGKWDDPNAWTSLGGDALGLVPGIGAISKGASLGVDTLQAVDGLVPAAGMAARGFVNAAGDVGAGAADASAFFRGVGNTSAEMFGGNADILAKSTQGTFNVGTQVPTVVDWTADGPTVETAKNAAGAASAGGNALQTAGTRTGNAEGLGELAGSLRRFGSALG